VLDQEAIRLRHGVMELLKRWLVIELQGTDEALDAVTESMANGKLFESEVDHDGVMVADLFSKQPPCQSGACECA
jgi:hypothetical protein